MTDLIDRQDDDDYIDDYVMKMIKNGEGLPPLLDEAINT